MVRATRGQRRSPLHGIALAASDPLPFIASPPPQPDSPGPAVPSAAVDESALESHSAETIGSSVATKKNLPKWFPSTRCTAGVNHTSPDVEETTPLETPSSTVYRAPPTPLTTQPTEASEQPADRVTSTVPMTTTMITTRMYASPPSPATAAFYVDDA